MLSDRNSYALWTGMKYRHCGYKIYDIQRLHSLLSPSPLNYASMADLMKVVATLLDQGADIDARDISNSWSPHEYGPAQTALYAASRSGHDGVVQLLLDRGADINAEGGEYGHPLAAALSGDHLDTANLLIERGADVNISWKHRGRSTNALISASATGYEDFVGMMIARGVSVVCEGRPGSTALNAAVGANQPIMIQNLLEMVLTSTNQARISTLYTQL